MDITSALAYDARQVCTTSQSDFIIGAFLILISCRRRGKKWVDNGKKVGNECYYRRRYLPVVNGNPEPTAGALPWG